MAIAESKRRCNDKYNAKCDYISIRPLKPIGEKIRSVAQESGKSLQGYILDAIDRQIAEDDINMLLFQIRLYIRQTAQTWQDICKLILRTLVEIAHHPKTRRRILGHLIVQIT